jgi:hypothetical protein
VRLLFRSSGRIVTNAEPTKATWTINRLISNYSDDITEFVAFEAPAFRTRD